MSFHKEIKGNELYLYQNGKLIYKRWLDTGQSKVFDVLAYDKYSLLSIKDEVTSDIQVRTLKMRAPRQAEDNSPFVQTLLAKEDFLRRTAYKRSPIKTGESFFNDSDMQTEYYLVVLYDAVSGTPLLSARHYFDKELILKFLKGDANEAPELPGFAPGDYVAGQLVLADRLSGNVYHPLYRRNRSRIFSLYYAELVNNNKNSSLLLMVRKQKYDKQLLKYLGLGFTLLGSTLHKGREHSIIIRDLSA